MGLVVFFCQKTHQLDIEYHVQSVLYTKQSLYDKNTF